jgi:hypothetical protein
MIESTEVRLWPRRLCLISAVNPETDAKIIGWKWRIDGKKSFARGLEDLLAIRRETTYSASRQVTLA